MKITSHRPVHDTGCVVAVLQNSLGKSSSTLVGARDGLMALPSARPSFLGMHKPLQLQPVNRLYRCMRVRAAQRHLSRVQGARNLSPGLNLVTQEDWPNRFSSTDPPPVPTSGKRSASIIGDSAKVSPHTTTTAIYVVLSWTIPDQSSSSFLPPARLQLSGWGATPSASTLAKVELFSTDFYATSMSPTESDLPTPK